jgi:hypothetical protein
MYKLLSTLMPLPKEEKSDLPAYEYNEAKFSGREGLDPPEACALISLWPTPEYDSPQTDAIFIPLFDAPKAHAARSLLKLKMKILTFLIALLRVLITIRVAWIS